LRLLLSLPDWLASAYTSGLSSRVLVGPWELVAYTPARKEEARTHRPDVRVPAMSIWSVPQLLWQQTRRRPRRICALDGRSSQPPCVWPQPYGNVPPSRCGYVLHS